MSGTVGAEKAAQIRDVYRAEVIAQGEAFVEMVMETRKPSDKVEDLVVRGACAGYSGGLEYGMAIAVADPEAARLYLAWVAEHLAEGKPIALEARARIVGAFLEVLRR